MKREKNRLNHYFEILKLGFVYLFIFLLINVGFSPVYKILAKKANISYDLELDSEEEKTPEDAKKLSELLDKEYFSSDDDISSTLFDSKQNNYFHCVDELLIHYPEKDSPPPKNLLFLS